MLSTGDFDTEVSTFSHFKLKQFIGKCTHNIVFATNSLKHKSYELPRKFAWC